MRDNVRNFIQDVSRLLVVQEPIVEIGSYQVPGQEGYADLKPFFPGKAFIGCDMRSGPGVDRVENVHNLTFPSASIGTVLTADTLEHVKHPYQALSEIHRVLSPTGMVVVVSVMNCEIHDYPNDYWRFTPQAFLALLGDFAYRLVGYQGFQIFPHTVLGLGFKSVPDLAVLQLFAEYQRTQRGVVFEDSSRQLI